MKKNVAVNQDENQEKNHEEGSSHTKFSLL
jgi:hypothetical protein